LIKDYLVVLVEYRLYSPVQITPPISAFPFVLIINFFLVGYHSLVELIEYMNNKTFEIPIIYLIIVISLDI
jgi:hypothetical protein